MAWYYQEPKQRLGKEKKTNWARAWGKGGPREEERSAGELDPCAGTRPA